MNVIVFEYNSRESLEKEKYNSFYQVNIDELNNIFKPLLYYKVIVPSIVIAVIKDPVGIEHKIPFYFFTRWKNNSSRLASCFFAIFGIKKLKILNVNFNEHVELIKKLCICKTLQDIKNWFDEIRKRRKKILFEWINDEQKIEF